MRGEVSRPSSTPNRVNLSLKFRVVLVHPPCIHSDEGLRALNYDVVTLGSEVEAQKRETEGSWMAKIQQVKEFNRSTCVTDALLPSIQVVGADIADCERARQTARVNHARFDRQLSKLTGIVAVRPHLNDNFLSR
jgi:hypothetical protein